MPGDEEGLEHTKSVQFPHIGIWSARLLKDVTFQRRILEEPLMFALAYAATSDILDWPEIDAKAKTAAESEAMDKLLETLKQLTAHFHVSLDGDFARRFKVGMATYEHYSDKETAFLSHFRRSRKLDVIATDLTDQLKYMSIPAIDTVDEIGKAIGLDDLQKEILLFAVGMTLSARFMALVSTLAQDAKLKKSIWETLFAADPVALKHAFSEESPLVKSGLLQSSGKLGTPQVSHFFVEFIVDEDTDRALFDRILKPLAAKKSAGAMPRIAAEDREIVQKILKAKTGGALNVLVYSGRDVERLHLVEELLQQGRLTGWMLNDKDVPGGDMPTLVFMAQKLLAARDEPKDVLVVDKAHQVLSSARRSAMSFFFGRDYEDDDELSSMDETLLSENPVHTLWLSNHARRIAEDSLARFLFHCELKKASRVEKKEQMEAYIRSLKLSEELKSELLRYEGLSEQQIQSAVDLAKLLKVRDPAEQGNIIKRAVEHSQMALQRTAKEKIRRPITHYSMDYLNTEGMFKPQDIINALKDDPVATICFYGLPGTGKTQLAENIALELGKPLIMKQASELLNMYVGESEKAIAGMFEEAEAEDAVLFLDEADTFLRDRALAHQSWEVSQVNELLQRMERFQGTFICATNLMKHVDKAALRRFTFKLSFHALTADQRWAMFLNETGLGERAAELTEAQVAEYKDALIFTGALTPGDFATVKRQCKVLRRTLTPEEWLKQLAIEVELRTRESQELERASI